MVKLDTVDEDEDKDGDGERSCTEVTMTCGIPYVSWRTRIASPRVESEVILIPERSLYLLGS